MRRETTVEYDANFEKLCEITRNKLDNLRDDDKLYSDYNIYSDRLDYELSVFDQSGYSNVILIISDYICWAKQNDVVVGPGRGSAAGSLVVYLCDITTVDPIKHNLIFERFLNPDRVSLPDIDTDFSNRDSVIEYLREKYGSNRVAKVGVPSLYKPRSAIDEIARSIGLDFNQTKKITKLIGDAKTFDQAFAHEPSLVEVEKEHSDLFELARNAQGYVRQITTHPSAVILSRGPIGAEIPMQKPPGSSKDGVLATGWDGEELDTLGYIKLDILTIDNLAIIDKAIKLIQERTGKVIDFYDLPLDDDYVLQGFVNGETVAVFQLEEAKSVGILKSMPGISFDEVCAVNALIRPGLDISQFLKARNHGDIQYVIPALAPILSETYGVILYQEQVMRICVDIAGFSMAEADKFRKIIAKTANQSVSFSSDDKDRFRDGYLNNGHDLEKFDDLWAMILSCQTYVFNKAHATCYGYIAYADMWLKRHYPIEFMCSALSIRSKEVYVKECGRLNINVRQPCVLTGDENYTIIDNEIVIGLSSVKHVGKKASTIIARRPYHDEFDFMSRAKPSKKQIESLIYSGSLDCFGSRTSIAHNFCKESLHDEVTISDLANGELDSLGFYLKHDPLSEYQDQLKSCITPLSIKQPKIARVGGMVNRIYEHQCKNGKMMSFINLLTREGDMDILMWPDDWSYSKKIISVGCVIVAQGTKTDSGTYAASAVENISK